MLNKIKQFKFGNKRKEGTIVVVFNRNNTDTSAYDTVNDIKNRLYTKEIKTIDGITTVNYGVQGKGETLLEVYNNMLNYDINVVIDEAYNDTIIKTESIKNRNIKYIKDMLSTIDTISMDNITISVKNITDIQKQLEKIVNKLSKDVDEISIDTHTPIKEIKDTLNKLLNDIDKEYNNTKDRIDVQYKNMLKVYNDAVYESGVNKYNPVLVYTNTIKNESTGQEVPVVLAKVPFKDMVADKTGIVNTHMMNKMFTVLFDTDIKVKSLRDIEVNFKNYSKTIMIKEVPYLQLQVNKIDKNYLQSYTLNNGVDLERVLTHSKVECYIEFQKRGISV